MPCVPSLPLLLVLPLLAAAACSAPDDHRRRTPLQSVARVLDLDFSARAQSRTAASLARLPGGVRHETQRLATLPDPASAAGREFGRLGALTDQATRQLGDELSRRPALPDRVLPSPIAFGQALADGLVDVGGLVVGQHPLPERDDRRHRTDPHDDRPEATFWQRLRPRLWL